MVNLLTRAYHKFRPMWALIALVFVLASPSCVRAQNVQVSGNVKSLTGVGSGVGVNVRFRLRGYTGAVPKVSGTGVVLPTTISCGVCIDFAPDINGNISGVLIYGNDQIQPGGTWYTVEFSYLGRIIFACDYFVSGTTFNFNSAACLNTIPQLASTSIITQSFIFVQSPAATTWTINHNFNDIGLVFDFYDQNNVYLIPDHVQNTSPNQTVATFINPQAGYAVLIHAGQIAIATNQPNALLSNPAGNQTTLFDLSTTGSFTSPVFRSNQPNPATVGIVRLASSDSVCWRNAANNADLCLNKNGSDQLLFGSFLLAYTNFANNFTAAQTFTLAPTFSASPGFIVTSTLIPNLNASLLLGNTWGAPGPIGNVTPSTAAFSSVTSGAHVTTTATPSLSGIFRCASIDACVTFRNNANNGDVGLGKNASDQPTFAGNILPTIFGAVSPGHLATYANSGQIQDGGIPNTAIQAASITTLGGDVGVTGGVLTTILTKSVTMPSVGCPCRVFVSYGVHMSTSLAIINDTDVTDGTNVIATASTNTTGSATQFGVSASSFTPILYANLASVTFTLQTQSNSNMTVKAAANQTGQNTWLNVVIMPSQ